jgi:nitroimidazol reductase NimA-like FMN-containing flavoprotein (pyridoxamine 5'-phosphate oxidase superfamily)
MRDRRRLQVMTREDCLRRLGRCGIGRVAVSMGALPAIFPVNYATLDGDIVFRTGPGTKLTAALRGSVVAFEVDGADRFAHTGWSVMVVGPADAITDPDKLVRAARLPLASWASGDSDVFVCIEGRLISGRDLSDALPVSVN